MPKQGSASLYNYTEPDSTEDGVMPLLQFLSTNNFGFLLKKKKKFGFFIILRYFPLVFKKNNLANVILPGYYYLYMLIILE